MAPARTRLLVSVAPRVFREALATLLARAADVEVVQAGPGEAEPERFDVAIVDAGVTVDAPVVVELLDEGRAAVVHRAGEDRVIDVRGTTGLLDAVAAQVGIDLGGGATEPGTSTRARRVETGDAGRGQ